MKVATIKYKSNRTLEALKELGKYLGFTVDEEKSPRKDNVTFINGVPVIPGDNSIDISELDSIFTGKGLDAQKLRRSEWQRKK